MELARAAMLANSLAEELGRVSGERERVRHLVAELDGHQRELQDRFDRDEVTEEEYLTAFRRARAGHAVLFALDEDPERAALETAYEANAAGVPIESIRETVDRVATAHGAQDR